MITSAFGLGALLALMPDSRRASRSCSSATCSRSRDADLLVAGLIALPVLALLCVLHERLLAVGFDRSSARAIGIAPRPVELA